MVFMADDGDENESDDDEMIFVRKEEVEEVASLAGTLRHFLASKYG